MDRTVTTTGTGRETQAPERARIEIDARGSGETPGMARDRATGQASKVRSAIEAASVSPDAVRTTSVRIQHRSELFETDEDDPEYRAGEQLTIDCDPEHVGELVVAATDAGGRLGDVSFGLTPETREQLHDRALETAMADARRKAERIANAEGCSVGAVREVTTQDGYTGMEGIVNEALEGGPDLTFHPDPIDVEASVEVVYAIE